MLKLLDISKICYIIQRLNSFNLLTNKRDEKSVKQITDQMKIAEKNIGELEKNFL